jgi:hypothetical protein
LIGAKRKRTDLLTSVDGKETSQSEDYDIKQELPVLPKKIPAKKSAPKSKKPVTPKASTPITKKTPIDWR